MPAFHVKDKKGVVRYITASTPSNAKRAVCRKYKVQVVSVELAKKGSNDAKTQLQTKQPGSEVPVVPKADSHPPGQAKAPPAQQRHPTGAEAVQGQQPTGTRPAPPPLRVASPPAKTIGPQPPAICTNNQLVDIKGQLQWLEVNRSITLRQIRAALDYFIEKQEYDNA